MPRHKAFSSPGRLWPFSGQEGVSLDHKTVRGPLPFFNPTQARFSIDDLEKRYPKLVDKKHPDKAQLPVSSAAIQWRSRSNRKGRHTLSVDRTTPFLKPTVHAVRHGLARIFTEFPYWDISFLIAVSFTIGSATFMVSGFFSWLPLVAPKSKFSGETTVASGVTSFIGATLFEIGAILLVFEACNENQTGCFGWALHKALWGDDDETASSDHESTEIMVKKDLEKCLHHHQRGRKGKSLRQPQAGRKWTWCPSWTELRTHYIHEIGFVASISLSIGATIFWITGICSLPGIFENMSVELARGLYWLTYLLGGVNFIVSSVLYTVENQRTWYTPAPSLIGWHIGVWNLVGSVGWTLAASWGYCTSSGCTYQSMLTLLWASTGFFIGSILQWYEALEKYPIERTG